MKRRAFFPVLISVSLSLSAFTAVGAESTKAPKPTQLEKNIDMAQKALDGGSFSKAERYWKKVQLELAKGTPDERLANALQKLGDTYAKESKYSDAESSYKQSIEVSKGISKDPQEAVARLQDLQNVYRAIDLMSFDETSTNFAKHVGAVSASAVNQQEKHHIEIALDKQFQEKIQELVTSFLPKKADGTTQEMPEIPAAAGAPPVKSLRLSKKITFDLSRGNDGNFSLANIEGIFFDVGLWAKLKGLVMIPTGQEKPSVELTAGAFGVEKKVKTDIPSSVYKRLKEGIDKFDPFAGAAVTASAGTSPPDSATSIPVVKPAATEPSASSSTGPLVNSGSSASAIGSSTEPSSSSSSSSSSSGQSSADSNGSTTSDTAAGESKTNPVQ